MKLIERLIEEGGSDSGSRNFVGPKVSENVVRLIGRQFPSYVESDFKKKKENRENVCHRYLRNTFKWPQRTNSETMRYGKRGSKETRSQCLNILPGHAALRGIEKYAGVPLYVNPNF
ncbi:hypothetical protein TNCV_1724261 [Trichonephila clavipes]|nr:hypothetical protein TNCV_1724261 [Trichonephila clavipes]